MAPFVHPLSPKRWFDSTIPVDRKSYLLSGLVLALAKYGIEAALVAIVTGRLWTPVAFLTPVASMRADALGDDTTELAIVIALLSLPFLFVGLSMSVRRSANAGRSPFFGLGFVFPFLNYVTMVALSVLPERPRAEPLARTDPRSVAHAATLGIASAVGFGLFCSFVALSEVFGPLGSGLFFLTPVIMGVIAGHRLNRDADRGARKTFVLTLTAGVSTAAALLLFALEGAICITMVLPIALPMVAIGGEVGRAIARAGRSHARPLALFVALPLFASSGALSPSDETHHVRTAVVVDAPPDVVFEHVVSFPPIDSPRPWYFRTGIAVPLRASIEGRGVGAVRHCEFTTGAFVEPITAWEPGRRLAFDVTSSPAPMEEWSPYRLSPKHLATTMRSRRGEFLLTPLPNGRTRLEGHTEYELGLAPDVYFAPLANWLVHRIHLRVLEHVAAQAERQGAARGGILAQ
jgi:hypothetical protein